MMELYKYMIAHGMKELKDVPEPYQTMLRKLGYQDDGTIIPPTTA